MEGGNAQKPNLSVSRHAYKSLPRPLLARHTGPARRWWSSGTTLRTGMPHTWRECSLLMVR